MTSEHGHKNKAKLFFFTDSLEIAKDLGKNAAIKNSRKEYFLTSTKTKHIRLIDFTNRYNIYQMLCVLQELKINVLTSNFRTYEDENNFEELKKHFEIAQLETDTFKRLKIINNLKVLSFSDFCDVSLFGQRLTDFENGVAFKELVQKNYPDIDGYSWQEFKDPRGFTVCLFDAKKLEQKKTEKIEVK